MTYSTYNGYLHFPIIVFGGIWATVALLFNYTPFPFHQIHSYTLYHILLSVTMVFAGFFFYRSLFVSRRSVMYSAESERSTLIVYYPLLAFLVLSIMVTVVVSAVINVQILAEEVGGVENYIANPIMTRQLINDQKDAVVRNWNLMHSLASYGESLLTLGCLTSGILFTSKRWHHKLLSMLPIVVAVALSLVKFSRYTFVSSLMFWLFGAFFFSYYLDQASRRRVLKNLLFFSVIVGAFTVFLFYLVVNLRFFTSANVDEIFILQVHSYFIGNVIGFDKMLTADPEWLMGKGLLRTVMKWFARLGLASETDVLSPYHPFVNIGPTFTNTYTYVRELYEDFGAVGLTFFSFGLGFLAAFTVHYFLQKFSTTNLFFCVILTFTLFMSFFSFHLLHFSTHLFIFLTIKAFDFLFLSRLVESTSSVLPRAS